MRNPTRRAMSRPSSVAKVMIPIPPTWIMTRMASSPNPDQKVGVSTTTRPVTHTADTAVNSAVTSPAGVPSSVATGSISRTVPTPTASANPATTAAAGRPNTASTGERRRATSLATPRRIEVTCASPPHRTLSDASFRTADGVSVAVAWTAVCREAWSAVLPSTHEGVLWPPRLRDP